MLTVLGATTRGWPRPGLGAALTVVGVVILGPVVARPVTAGARCAARVGCGASPARSPPTARPATPAARRPARRRCWSASAVVTLFTVFGASLKASMDETVDRTFAGDLVVSSGAFGGSGLDPQFAVDLRALPDGRRRWPASSPGLARIGDDDVVLTATDPAALAQVADLGVTGGVAGRPRPRRHRRAR